MAVILAGGLLAPRLGLMTIPMVVALFGGVWIVADPDRALIAYLIAIPLSSAFIMIAGVELAKPVFAVLVVAWLPTLRRWRPLKSDIPLWGLAFVAWCAISGLISRFPMAALGNAFRIFGYIIFLIIAADRLRNACMLRRSVAAVLAPSVAMAALGIYQFLTGTTILGLGLHPATGTFVTWKGYVQASGVFDHPNVFATYMFVYLCLALGLTLFVDSRRVRLPLLVTVLASSAGLVLSFSRSGWIGFMASVVLFVLLYPRFIRLVPVVIGVVVVLILVLPQEQVEGLTRRTTPEMDSSLMARVGAYKTGWRMFTENPVLGVGLGSFYRRFLDYKVPGARFPKNYIRGSESGMEAHSTYLQLLAETGVPGLLLFLAFNFAVARQIILLLRRGGRGFDRGLAIGLAAAFAALVVQNAFNSQEYLKAYWLVAALVAGAAESAHRSAEESGQ